MTYRHAEYAGNRGDIFKHLVLSRLLAAMTRETPPFLYFETHAGAGRYRLPGKRAAVVERICERPDRPALLSAYAEALSSHNPEGGFRCYPGSPLLAQNWLRPGDRALLCELHPAEHAELQNLCGSDPRFRLMRADGYSVVRSELPNHQGRRLVLIDPPFVEDAEYPLADQALETACSGCPDAVCALWYPLTGNKGEPARPAAGQRFRNAPWMRVELSWRAAGYTMYGAGMLVVNPPAELQAELRQILPWLLDCLADGQGNWRVET